MKIKTSEETVKKLIGLLEAFDASTEQFLDELPTPEKYAILAMALTIRDGCDDFEIVFEESMLQVSANDLTRHLMDFAFLAGHLKDALGLKWSYFEQAWSDDKEEDDNDA